MSELEKYRRAGLVAQAGLQYAIDLLNQSNGDTTCGEICREVDRCVAKAAEQGYRSVNEKGIAFPCELCRNEFVRGVCPESYDTFQGGLPAEGDLVTISLGTHIDGYTAFGAHTVIVHETEPQGPYTGPGADSVVASALAVEAIVSLLAATLNPSHPLLASGPVTGQRIRSLVESVAIAFNCAVVPGSRVRRISQYVAAQPAVHEANAKAVEWHEEMSEEVLAAGDDWEASAGEAYVIDIAMTARPANVLRLKEFHGYGSEIDAPSVYNRDYTVSYSLKMPASRALLSKADRRSVFPFKISYIAENVAEENRLRSGLRENVQRRLLLALPRLIAPENVAREATTVLLVKAGTGGITAPEVLRLTGGLKFPPSWVQSQFELPAGDAADCLNSRNLPHTGVRYMEITGKVDNFASDASKDLFAAKAGNTVTEPDSGMEIE